MSQRTATCATCRFFNHYFDTSEIGACHRNAPVTNSTQAGDARTVWPEVGTDDWCGEHQDSGDWRLPNTAVIDSPSTGRAHE
jgi:hypothetical protein